jgi:site-specific DNA recombinase
MEARFYLRIACLDENAEDSPAAQRNCLERHCANRGLSVGPVYCDAGVSGLTPFEQRPGGKQLLDDARQGGVECLLIYSLDRLARDLRVMFDIVTTLTDCGVRVTSLSEQLESVIPVMRMLPRIED